MRQPISGGSGFFAKKNQQADGSNHKVVTQIPSATKKAVMCVRSAQDTVPIMESLVRVIESMLPDPNTLEKNLWQQIQTFGNRKSIDLKIGLDRLKQYILPLQQNLDVMSWQLYLEEIEKLKLNPEPKAIVDFIPKITNEYKEKYGSSRQSMLNVIEAQITKWKESKYNNVYNNLAPVLRRIKYLLPREPKDKILRDSSSIKTLDDFYDRVRMQEVIELDCDIYGSLDFEDVQRIRKTYPDVNIPGQYYACGAKDTLKIIAQIKSDLLMESKTPYIVNKSAVNIDNQSSTKYNSQRGLPNLTPRTKLEEELLNRLDAIESKCVEANSWTPKNTSIKIDYAILLDDIFSRDTYTFMKSAYDEMRAGSYFFPLYADDALSFVACLKKAFEQLEKKDEEKINILIKELAEIEKNCKEEIKNIEEKMAAKNFYYDLHGVCADAEFYFVKKTYEKHKMKGTKVFQRSWYVEELAEASLDKSSPGKPEEIISTRVRSNSSSSSGNIFNWLKKSTSMTSVADFYSQTKEEEQKSRSFN